MAPPHIDSDGLTPEQARYKSGQLRLIQPSGTSSICIPLLLIQAELRCVRLYMSLASSCAGYIQHISRSSAGIEPAGFDGRIGAPAVTKAADWVITGMTPFL